MMNYGVTPQDGDIAQPESLKESEKQVKPPFMRHKVGLS